MKLFLENFGCMCKELEVIKRTLSLTRLLY